MELDKAYFQATKQHMGQSTIKQQNTKHHAGCQGSGRIKLSVCPEAADSLDGEMGHKYMEF